MRPSGDLISTRAPWHGWRLAVRTPLQSKGRVRRAVSRAAPWAPNSPAAPHADQPTDQRERNGRKAELIATLLLMGIATFLVALVPTYEQAGIWGAVILTVLRFIQGIGVGGEWGGSVLMSMEWARSNKSRGFIASWPQFGVPCGLFLANLAVLAFSRLSGDQFLRWGWRVPFLLSLLLVGVGLYIRPG